MTVTRALRAHYRCVFDIAPRFGENEVDWSAVVKTVRSWISQKQVTDDDFVRAWFFRGGKWTSPSEKRFTVETRVFRGSQADARPQFWSLRYEHPCAQADVRDWRTDIGLEVLSSGLLRFSLLTSHSLRPGYYGEDPTEPPLSAPAVVLWVLRQTSEESFFDTFNLSSSATTLELGRARDLLDRLADASRAHPVVLVSVERGTGKPLIDVDRLAYLLAGLATVVVAESPEVDEEIRWVFDEQYRCHGGMVRVYQPSLDTARPSDFRRHRFFLPGVIRDRGAPAIERIIAKCAVRWAVSAFSETFTSLDDVDARARAVRMADLACRLAADQQSHSAELREWLELHDSETAALHKTLSGLREENARLEFDLESAVLETEDFRADLQSARTSSAQAWSGQDTAFKRIKELEGSLNALESLSALPETLPEVVDTIQRLHPGRVFFTDKARAAAENAVINESHDGVQGAWRCLWSIATTLHELHFGSGQESDISTSFRDVTGFEHAPTEGEHTKKHKRLAAMRTDTFDGREIVANAHVKYGDERPKCLRVHYYPHHGRELIVVVHCGDHLETYGTQRRR